MWSLLARLEHPERKLPPVIHVAGTNGKGSTIAFMRAILEAAGQDVHVYTSPHLVRFNERFRLAAEGGGKLVDDAELRATLEECERVNAGDPITVFEITTAAGLLLFSRHPADVLLLEVGLGGRLDATNVVDAPLLSVITPVSLDHADYLGDSIESVAAEKAGILKRGVRAVIGPQMPEALVRHRTRGRARARAAARLRRALECERGASPPGLSGRRRAARPAGPEADRPPSIRECRRRGRGLARLGSEDSAARPTRPASLKAEWPARMQRLTHGNLVGAGAAGQPRSGSMAGTIRTAAARSRCRSPISRSARRSRWS